MEEIIKYLEEKKYKLIDITASINEEKYEKYAKILEKNPTVIAYFKRNDTNNSLFENKGPCSKKCDYCLMQKNKYLLVEMNNPDKNLKICLSKFLEDTIECGICFELNDFLSYCGKCFFGFCEICLRKISDNKEFKCPQCNGKIDYSMNFNADEMKEYVTNKGCTFEDITELVTKQNFNEYMSKRKENDFLIIRKNKNTEFIFKLQENNVVDDIKKHNMTLIGYGGCTTIRWINKLEENHKLLIDTLIKKEEIINCDICSIETGDFGICNKCKYRMCDECLQKIVNCPGCK